MFDSCFSGAAACINTEAFDRLAEQKGQSREEIMAKLAPLHAQGMPALFLRLTLLRTLPKSPNCASLIAMIIAWISICQDVSHRQPSQQMVGSAEVRVRRQGVPVSKLA
jgi:hypothetical protein